MLHVRPATDRDTPQIGRFLEDFRSMAPQRRGAQDFIDFSSLAASEGKPEASEDSLVLLGLHGDDLIAVGALRFGPTGAVTRASFELFCSDGSERSRKVLQTLIDAAEAVALARGVREVDIMSLPGDQPLKSSLEERGYRARLLIMHRAI